MSPEHRQTINTVKSHAEAQGNYVVEKGKRWFGEDIKKENKRGAWGYTPDIVIRKKDSDKFVIIEVEYGVILSKVIEDIVLSSFINLMKTKTRSFL